MFSIRSVSVQPSAPPIEYAGVPDAFSVDASFKSCGHVFGALTPAPLNAGTLYQIVDLFAPLKTIPYRWPLIVPRSIQLCAKFFFIVGLRKSIGFSAPRLWKSFTSPGWATDARSGGFPPWTAVERIVGVLSPPEVYLTLTSGFAFVKPSMTAWKRFSSGPLQTPMIEMLPLTPTCLCRAPAVPTTTSDRAVAAIRPSARTRNFIVPYPSLLVFS